MSDPFLAEAAIRERVLALRDAVRDDKEEAAIAALTDLAINTLIDLRRIADAAERLAAK